MNTLKEFIESRIQAILSEEANFTHSAFVHAPLKKKPLIWGIGKTEDDADKDATKNLEYVTVPSKDALFGNEKSYEPKLNHYRITRAVHDHVYEHGHSLDDDNRKFKFDHENRTIKMRDE